ncbi:MAG: ABC transporter ATP-binding protein [Candidatus Woesearchaeota archaeon]
MRTMLKVRNLDVAFKEHYVLKNLSFDVPKNTITGFISPSGGGKTTILRCLAGLQKPNNIDILYDGHLQLKNISEFTGYSFQENSLYEDLTLEENMLFFGTQLGLKEIVIKKRTESIVDILKLRGYEQTLAKNFSGGMKKRLDIAITLLNNPDILLLDEPFAGLDKPMRIDLWNLLIGLKNMGKTLILTTHLLDEFDLYADYVVKIEQGVNAHQGYIKDIMGYWCLELLFTKDIDLSIFKNFKVRRKDENIIFYLKTKEDAIKLTKQLIDANFSQIIKKINIYKDTSNVIS